MELLRFCLKPVSQWTYPSPFPGRNRAAVFVQAMVKYTDYSFTTLPPSQLCLVSLENGYHGTIYKPFQRTFLMHSTRGIGGDQSQGSDSIFEL